MEDPYEVLGIEPGAGLARIRAARRELVLRFHPDLFVEASPEEQRAADEQTKQINHAYAVLTNPEERARFERQQKLAERRSTRATTEPGSGANFTATSRTGSEEPDTTTTGRHQWRTEQVPEDLVVREFNGWGDAHWVYVHAPGGRAGMMNVTTGEVTIEREELRDQVLRVLQHYAFDSWS